MNKNLVTAIALSLAIYFLWFKWAQKKYPDYYQKKGNVEITESANKTIPQEDFQVQQIAEKTQKTEYEKHAAVSEKVNFNIPKVSLTFDTKGAAISSFKFEGPVEEAELVQYSSPGFFSTMSKVNFQLKEKRGNLISFQAFPSPGIIIDKTYKWNTEGGLNKLIITTTNRTGKIIQFPEWSLNIGPGIGTVKTQQKENTKLWKSAFAILKEGKKNPSLKNLKKETPGKDWIWAGVQNRYFLACILGNKKHNFDLKYKETNPAKKIKAPSAVFTQSSAILKPGETKKWEIDFYFGPKDYRKLTSIGHSLSRSVEFGFFSQLGKIAMKILYYNQKITGNYGWSIIILTILVQILMFPLTYKSSKSMMLMKKLQPELKIIQQKYKKDPKRLNQEMMGLYKKHGANPFGGCLPMLVQIPIFFALFTALRNSWDLHGAQWIFWVSDLSAKDPFYVLPITMGAIMFFQQKMTMVSADKSQAAVFKWMPIIFTFMFLSFPAGLVLYWLTSNLISFMQQLYLRKMMPANK